jgi:TRAP-type uncharacterized transport system substrate-binding protein
MQYESVTQIVLLLIESMLQNVKQLQHARGGTKNIKASWFRSTSSCEVLFPLHFGAEQYQSLEIALTNVR